jgi:beta-galactosidase
MNRIRLYNDGWEFAKSGLDIVDWSEFSFAAVDLPHDWLIYDTLQLYENSIGWYRRTLECSREELAENRLWLAFEGVYMDSSIYVNGSLVGEWKYGYSSFEFDLTAALTEGSNEIVVKVVHQSPNSRWYSGAGIYRNVWLKTRSVSFIATDSVYIHTRKSDAGWLLEVETEYAGEEGLELVHKLLYEGKVVATSTAAAVSLGEKLSVNRQTLHVEQPLLWSPDHPHLYKLVTVLRRAASGEEIEQVINPVGFRWIQMDPEQGFSLNGIRMKLNGTCEHHDFGALGAVFNKAAARRRFRILKEMGVNAVRTAHNMPAPELMELADEMGLLVISESFDMWERSKTPYDYGRFFPEWSAADVRSWVRRDRNHPSLLMWCIGNEIYDTHADERGQVVTRQLMEQVRLHDPKGNAPITIGSNYMPWENAQKCADIVKLAGYNYAEKYYGKHHEAHPDWIIYGSETSSVVQSRGIYRFPVERSVLADDDEQCSALGNSPTSWGAKSPEACITADRDTPFSLGQFIWSGFDYIGEPTPYHTKNSYFGQIDTATFPKDSYYLYQAEWTDYKTRPMVHLYPYWDFNPGQLIDVCAVSNAPRIELRFNGETVGYHDIDHVHGAKLVGRWKLPYREGILTALAYDEAGLVIATASRSSFGDASRIRLTPDKLTMQADGTDLIFVEIAMEDEAGCPVENANNRVQVEVSGAGRLLGLDNGDSTDYDPYKGLSRRLFSGKLMAVIGAALTPGGITVRVSSTGMESRSLELEALPSEVSVEGLSANMGNEDMTVLTGRADEIPLRKIELESAGGQQLDASRKQVEVQARLYPPDTSYTELEWSVVDDAGIKSNIARVEGKGHTAVLTALGDGSFRVRCTSRNGTDRIKLISQLEFQVSGIGTAYLDPYGFVSAGLYDYSKGEISNGNERGVATSRELETQVGFHNIDFGPYGSDTITLPIFALSSEEYPLQIWEGMPGEEGSLLVADVVYQKPSKWNTYQEETFKLSKRLSGVTSLAFVVRQKIHLKGFSFTRHNRAFGVNPATECDRIYGDTYTRTLDAVEEIGNNVSLEYDGMDFGSTGTSRLVVYGRSPIDKNTIRIRFEHEEGESQQLVEFTRSEGYEERSFVLEPVAGVQKVTFIFLPGSRFDFGWFRFE